MPNKTEEEIHAELRASGWDRYGHAVIRDASGAIVERFQIYKKGDRVVKGRKPTALEALEDVLAQTQEKAP